jgi:hypothetical protein
MLARGDQRKPFSITVPSPAEDISADTSIEYSETLLMVKLFNEEAFGSFVVKYSVEE